MSTTTQPQQPPLLSGLSLALLTLGLALGTFMEVLDVSIANVSIPTIAGDLGVAPTQATWVISSYSVSSAIAVPLTGWLAQRIGQARLFLISMLLFTIFSTLCGLAQNFETLIAFRLMQGLVSGPMVPLSQTILLRNYPKDKQGLALGLWAMTIIVAPIAGPMMGGWITENFSWPWIFYLNVPAGALAFLLCFFLLKGQETPIQKVRIDGMGLGLLVIGVGCLQTMLDLGKDHDWFNSNLIRTLAIVAAVSLIFLVAWELTEQQPVIDLKLFKNRNFCLGTVILSLGFMGFFGAAVVFPLWLQIVMGYTASKAGLATALVGVLALVLSPLVGSQLHKLNLRLVASTAFLVFAIVFYWSSHFNLEASFRAIAWPRLIQGIGIACFFVPMTTIALSEIRPEQMASAAGLSNFLRTLAGAMGTAASTTYWEEQAIRHRAVLSEHITPYSDATKEFINKASSLNGDSSTHTLLLLERVTDQQAYMIATNDLFRNLALCFVVLCFTVWLTRPPRHIQSSAVH